VWEHHKIEKLKKIPDFEFQPMQKNFLKTKIECNVPYFGGGGGGEKNLVARFLK